MHSFTQVSGISKMGKLSIEQVNSLSREEFVNVFGNAVESYPEASESIFPKRPFENIKMLCDAFVKLLEEISLDGKRHQNN